MVQRAFIREGAFRETPEGVVLLGNRCKSCGQVFFPKAGVCFNCFSENMEELPLSRRGKLYSYSIGRMASLHFEPPYALGYIDLPEGVRVLSPLKIEESEYGSLRIGMEMEVIIEKLWQEGDKEVIGWKFEPVAQGDKS